jgi:predicted  nucleic acid-binding Zn-ribbon protein
VESELKSLRDDLEHLRNWKKKIESQVHAVEDEQRLMEERLDRLDALKELRLAGGPRSDGAEKAED